MTLPTKFRKHQSRVITSFDFIDIVSGTTFVKFFPMDVRSGAGTDKQILSKFIAFALNGFTQATPAVTLDLDWDLPIGNHTVLNGNAIINTPVSASGTYSGTFTYKLFRVRSGGETQIGTTTTTSVSVPNATSKVISVEIPLVNEILKNGDSLRLNLVTSVTGGGVTLFVYFDPKDLKESLPNTPQSHNLITTQAAAIIPIKVQT